MPNNLSKIKQESEREFNKQFIRQDGLMNKYSFVDYEDFEISTGEAIKHFLLSKLELAYNVGQEEEHKIAENFLQEHYDMGVSYGREAERKEMVEKISAMKKEMVDKSYEDMDIGYNLALDEIKKLLE